MNLNRYLPWLGVGVIVAVLAMGAISETFLKPLIMLTVMALMAVLISKPQFLLIITTLLMSSELTFDFLPQQVSFYMVTGTMFFISVAMGAVLHRRVSFSRDEKKLMFWLCGLLVVLAVTALIRGTGLKIFGSEKWGGRPYILLVFSSLFLFFSLFVKLNPAQCKRLLYGFCLAGLFPSIAAIALHYGGTNILTQFVGLDDDAANFVRGLAGSSDPLFRLQVANVGATYLFLLMWLVLYSKGLMGHVAMALCGITGVILTGISGHRISLVYGVILSVAFFVTDRRVTLFRRLFNWYSLLSVGTLAAMVMFSSYFPYTFQRSMAWLPFVNVAADARFDVEVTSEWRVEVWRRVFEVVPQYLMLGKGFAFSSDEILSYINWTMNDYNFVLTSHNYHNGMVHVLIDLGLPGLFFAVGLIVLVLRVHYPLLSCNWANSMLSYFHRVILSGFIAQVAVYLVIGGGVTTFVTLFFMTAMLEQLRKAGVAVEPPVGGGAEPGIVK